MKKIKTTENKLRKAGWFNKRNEPGYFTKTIGNTRAVIALDNFRRHPDEICNFDVWWYDVPTPYELNLLEEELKKVEVTQMKKDRPKTVIIKSNDEFLSVFENAYIDALTDNELVITYYDKSVMYKTIIHLDADIVTGIEIKED